MLELVVEHAVFRTDGTNERDAASLVFCLDRIRNMLSYHVLYVHSTIREECSIQHPSIAAPTPHHPV